MTEETQGTTDIVNYDEELAKLAKLATKTERPDTSSINVKAGIITYNKQPVPNNKLDCIIIASTHANLYYDEKYDQENPKNPVCFAYSEDPDENPMAPHPASSKPQAETCAECWANKWKSDPEGGKGKACKNIRRLALVPAGVQPADIATAEVATFNIPVTSTNAWGMYVNKIATLFARPPLGVVTQIGTVPDMKTQFKVTFLNLDPLVGRELLPGLFQKSQLARSLIEKVYEPNAEEQPEEAEEKAAKAEKSKARGKKF